MGSVPGFLGSVPGFPLASEKLNVGLSRVGITVADEYDQCMSKTKKPRVCPDCHFVCRWSRQIDSRKSCFEMSQEDRETLRVVKKAFCLADKGYTIGCYFGVWDAGEPTPQEPGSTRDLDCYVSKPRGEKCFYFGYTPGMGFAAAEELQRRAADRREAARDRALTRKAIWVAVAALIASIVIATATLSCDIWKYYQPSR